MHSIPTAARAALATCVLATAAAAAQAAHFKDLHDFTASPDGREPSGSVVALGGLLYGTTNVGGATDNGCVYSIDPATGEETVLYSFTGAFGGQGDGSAPVGEMVAIDGVLYGASSFGGQFSGGTIFSFDPSTGVETVLHSFGGDGDGVLPAAGLVAAGTTLYGTTAQGGSADDGTVFAFDLGSMQETVLHAFAGFSDGAAPFAPLTIADGLLYGTTFRGGAGSEGTVFRIDPATTKTKVLHAFKGSPFGGNPAAGLAFSGGLLYGTTSEGGNHLCGGEGCGTVFRIDPADGASRVLHRFGSHADGFDPEGGLAIHGGILYGTTTSGGKHKSGTLFSIDLGTGVETKLHDFKFPLGANPGTLVDVAGTLYGTTHSGGGAAEGTVFEYKP